MKSFRHIFIITTILLFAGCDYDDFGALNVDPKDEILPNAHIDLLRDNYFGGNFTIPDSMVFAGRVTANDRSGNFFRSFILQDESGAMEIYAGFYDLHNVYHIGQRVAVRAQGLAVGMYNGVLQLGLRVNGWSDYRVEPFGAFAVADRYLLRGDDVAIPSAMQVEIGELEQSMCGRLVKIDGLHFDGTTVVTWATPASPDSTAQTRYRQFKTNAGDSLLVVTSGYADFAGKVVPSGQVNLTGILLYGKMNSGKERFALKIRDLNDVENE